MGIEGRTHDAAKSRFPSKAGPIPMAEQSLQEVTQMLAAASGGDKNAAEKLMPLVYDELRALAAGALRRERIEHTLQPTALVHEAFLRLIDQSNAE
jgi:hypothetical protein